MIALDPYLIAQTAIANLKASVRLVLERGPSEGMTNAEIGRTLGIYTGHKGHEGHVSRTLLSALEAEGVAKQDKTSKRWTLRVHDGDDGAEP